MAKEIRIDEALWDRVVAVADATDREPSDVIEAALESYLFDRIRAAAPSRNDLSDEAAMELAVREVRAYRAEKRARTDAGDST